VPFSVGHVVLSDLRQVEVDVLAMLNAQRFSAGKNQWQVRIAMTVSVSHAAAPQNLCAVDQTFVAILVIRELVQEVTELLDQERIGLTIPGKPGEKSDLSSGLVPMGAESDSRYVGKSSTSSTDFESSDHRQISKFASLGWKRNACNGSCTERRA